MNEDLNGHHELGHIFGPLQPGDQDSLLFHDVVRRTYESVGLTSALSADTGIGFSLVDAVTRVLEGLPVGHPVWGLGPEGVRELVMRMMNDIVAEAVRVQVGRAFDEITDSFDG